MAEASDEKKAPEASPFAGGDEEVKVGFHHQFFAKLGSCYFQVSDTTREPVLMVEYGEQMVALPLPGLKRELDLAADSDDGKMLELVIKGLKFVNVIQMGDPLPSEILSGKASWPLSPQHAQIAYQRLTLKLITWMSGGGRGAAEQTSASAEDIVKQFKDPEVRKKVQNAFGDAAEALGLGRDQREEVVTYLETLAQELGYIEALRDRFGHILKINQRLAGFQELARKGQRKLDALDQCVRLLKPCLAQFMGLFKEADAQVADIMAVLRELDNQITAIRAKRDEIYLHLVPWNGLIEDWEAATEVDVSGPIHELIARTVRLLAPRFMPTQEWVLQSKRDAQKKASVKVWRSAEQQRDDVNKVLGRVMRW